MNSRGMISASIESGFHFAVNYAVFYLLAFRIIVPVINFHMQLLESILAAFVVFINEIQNRIVDVMIQAWRKLGAAELAIV